MSDNAEINHEADDPIENARGLKVEAGASLEELAANWERAGFGCVAAAIRDIVQNH